jgi:hypothetical protein
VSITEWFYQGGIFMWFVLYADVLAIVVTVALLIVYTPGRYKIFLTTLIVTGLLPLLFGVAGHWIGYQQVMAALPSADPSEKQALYEASMAIIRIPSIFGGVSSAALLLAGYLGLKLR